MHVFAHGWQPGFRTRERLLATVDGVQDLPAWDPRLVGPGGRALIDDFRDLLTALSDLGPDHLVLAYSWLADSATENDIFQAHRSRRATPVNGRRLAMALHEAGVVSSHNRLHLIGHSHGSAVISHAAVSLGRRPEQLTLLDAPEDPLSRAGGASDLIDVVLPRLEPGRLPGQTFVDSYASAFGRPYHLRPHLAEVVDVQLGASLRISRDPVKAVMAMHLYPLQWYARSIRERERGVGYGWSPLTGADPEKLHSWYYAALPQRPLALTRHAADPLTRFGDALAVRRRTGGVRPVPRTVLRAKADQAAAVVLTTERGDELVEFDLRLHACSGQEIIDIDLDGAPSFTALAGHRVPLSGRYLMLADGLAGEHLISLRLRPGPQTSADASVEVRNLRLISNPRPVQGFTFGRQASVIFGSGAAVGGVAAAAGLVAGRYLVKRVIERH